MSQAHIQGTTGPGTLVNPVVIPFVSDNTAGNLLFTHIWWYNNASSVVSVNDTQGNTWYPLPLQTVGSGIIISQAWYAPNCKLGPNTVSITTDATVGTLYYATLDEYSGVTALDQHAEVAYVDSAHNSGYSSPNITTTHTDLLIAYGVTFPGPSSFINLVSPWTDLAPSGFNRIQEGYQLNVTPGTYSATWTWDGTGTETIAANIAAFYLYVPPPSPASISPTSVTQGYNGNVTVTGTNFSTGTLSFSGSDITVNSYSVQNSTTITANITMSGTASVSVHDVTVTNADAQTGTLVGAFSVIASTVGSKATKRLMPSSLISFLQTSSNVVRADLFVIKLPNGNTIYATEGQWDITVPGNTPGWPSPPPAGSRVFSAANVSPNDNTILTSTSAAINTLQALTLAAWVYNTSDNSSYYTIVWKGPANGPLLLNFAGTYFAQVAGTGGGAIANAGTFAQNSWTHVAMTFDYAGDKKVRLYVNGSLLTTSSALPAGTLLDDSGSGMYIGNDIYGDGWTGSIAEVVEYNVALTDPQIASLAASTTGATAVLPGNIVGYWHLDGTASPEPDVSGNGNDGVLSANAPTQGAASPGYASFGPAQVFSASTYGRWSRGSITSEAGFSFAANSMTLSCVPQQATLYPGTSAGILAAAFNGLFGRAPVTVYTAYMPIWAYGDVTNGIEPKFVGFIEKINNINRTKVEFEVQDPLFILNEKLPKRLIQSSCPWSFCDVNCGLTAATYTQAFTAKSGSTQSVLTPVSAFAQAAGYFTQGVVTCTAGANVGLSATVKLHDASGNINVVMPWLFPVVAGDAFAVIAGCDKTATSCKTRTTAAGSPVDNSIHFGGAIAVPVPDKAI